MHFRDRARGVKTYYLGRVLVNTLLVRERVSPWSLYTYFRGFFTNQFWWISYQLLPRFYTWVGDFPVQHFAQRSVHRRIFKLFVQHKNKIYAPFEFWKRLSNVQCHVCLHSIFLNHAGSPVHSLSHHYSNVRLWVLGFCRRSRFHPPASLLLLS